MNDTIIGDYEQAYTKEQGTTHHISLSSRYTTRLIYTTSPRIVLSTFEKAPLCTAKSTY